MRVMSRRKLPSSTSRLLRRVLGFRGTCTLPMSDLPRPRDVHLPRPQGQLLGASACYTSVNVGLGLKELEGDMHAELAVAHVAS